RDDLVHGARNHAPLALVAHEVARDAEPPGAATEQGADEGEGRAREEAAAEGEVIAVLDSSDGVLERGQLLARCLGLSLEPGPRHLEVVLAGGDGHAMISPPFWERSRCSTVWGSSGWSG